MQGWEFYSKNAACGEKSPLTLLKADLKTRLLCQTVEQTVLLFCSFIFLSESTALSKSPPDFQLLSLVAVPDKQNLLDQADFTAAPAHMATSVAHSLSWGDFSPPSTVSLLCLKFTFLQILTLFYYPPIIHQVLVWLYIRSSALWRNQLRTEMY